MSAEAPLDWVRFTSLADGDEALTALIEFYLEYTDSELRLLQSAIVAGSVREVEAAAHRLAGSSATAGAGRIAAPLAEIEAAAHGGSIVDAGRRLREAEAAFASIRDFLEGRLTNRVNES